MSADGTRRLLAHLFDDAALFPPGNAPMPEALAGHARHRSSWYAEFVGPFLCTDVRLDELGAALRAGGPGDEPLRLVVLATGGAASARGIVEAVRREPRLALAGVEVPPPPEGDARAAVHHLSAVAAEVPTFLEVPRGAGGPMVLDALVGSGVGAKLRTGGTTPSAFPDEQEVARFLHGCMQRELRCKCTAGLHHAVRHTDALTGFEHHGFLNLLLAVDGVLQGCEIEAVVGVLAQRDPAPVVAAVRRLPDERGNDVRRRFASYGTCDVLEPLADAVQLGLLQGGRGGTATTAQDLTRTGG